jgi:hypothetical protein
MEELRSSAFKIYLQHALCSALTAESLVKQRQVYLRPETVTAAASWVQFCRNAQTYCGVLGLVALDRAESCLSYSLQYDFSFCRHDRTVSENLAWKYEKSAKCYVRALCRQQSSDSSNEALWSQAGAVYDQDDADKQFFEVVEARMAYREDHDLQRWRTRALEYEADIVGSYAAHHEITTIRSEIARTYRTALAQYEVSVAMVAIASAEKVHDDVACLASATAADHLESVLNYTREALECNTNGKELQALWRVCAAHMRNAAETARTMRGDDNNSAEWACSGEGLANIAEKLSPVVRKLDSLTVNAPSFDLRDADKQLAHVFQLINEFPLVSHPESDDAASFEVVLLEDAIDDIAFKLERAVARATLQKAVQAHIIAADKTDADRSPAHPFIKQCWQGAAKQMGMAAAATTEAELQLCKLRSFLHEKLVVGPLATAAHYFARADSTATAQARELWLQAAELQLTVAVPLVECLQEDDGPESADELDFDRDEIQQVLEARQLADAAVCSERVGLKTATGIVPSAEDRLQEAELDLRLALTANVRVLTRRAHDIRELTKACNSLLKWFARNQSPVSTIPSSGAPNVSASEHSPEASLDRAIWLCETAAGFVRMYSAAEASSSILHAIMDVALPLRELVNEIVDGDPICDDDSVRMLSVAAAREAGNAFLSGSTEECFAWMAAASQRFELHKPVRREIFNRLVGKACELRNGCGSTAQYPALLAQCALTNAYSYTEIDSAATALMECQRQMEVYKLTAWGEEQHDCADRSVSQFLSCANYIITGLSDTRRQHKSICPATYLVRGARAKMAGYRYAAAAEAAAAEQWEVYTALYNAADCASEVELDVDGVRVADGYSSEQLPMATKAAERFAHAADALVAGDKELHQLWLKAAEATLYHLQSMSACDSARTLAKAEALAQEAQQHHDAKGRPGNNSDEQGRATVPVQAPLSAESVGQKRKCV